jgi:hypothetical protein
MPTAMLSGSGSPAGFNLNVTPPENSPYPPFTQRVNAQAGPVRVMLRIPLEISGKVIDAATGKPIPEFRLTYGPCVAPDKDDVTWANQAARTIANGRYEASIIDFPFGGKLKVEAEGYEPSISRLIKADEGKITVDFELKSASPNAPAK